jgi:hypothetical protein
MVRRGDSSTGGAVLNAAKKGISYRSYLYDYLCRQLSSFEEEVCAEYRITF